MGLNIPIIPLGTHIAVSIGDDGAIKNTASGMIPRRIGIRLITTNLRLLIFS